MDAGSIGWRGGEKLANLKHLEIWLVTFWNQSETWWHFGLDCFIDYLHLDLFSDIREWFTLWMIHVKVQSRLFSMRDSHMNFKLLNRSTINNPRREGFSKQPNFKFVWNNIVFLTWQIARNPPQKWSWIVIILQVISRKAPIYHCSGPINPL